MDIRLRTHQVEGATVVEVGGDVELHSAQQLRDELSHAGEPASARASSSICRAFPSSIPQVLGVLVGAFKRVRENGSLSVVCPQRSVRRVFEITGLLQIFPFHQNLAEAVKAVRCLRCAKRFRAKRFCAKRVPTPASSTRSGDR